MRNPDKNAAKLNHVHRLEHGDMYLDIDSRPMRYRTLPSLVTRQRRIAEDEGKSTEEILCEYAQKLAAYRNGESDVY